MKRNRLLVNTAGMPVFCWLAYVAGFFDAEGCIRISRHVIPTPDGRGRPVYQVVLLFVQNNRAVLEFVQLILDCGGALDHGRLCDGSRSPIFSLRYSSEQAMAVLELLMPFLRRKWAEAMKIVEFCREGEIGRRGKKPVGDALYAIRGAYFEELKAMKHAENQVWPAGSPCRAWAAGFLDGDGCISIKKGGDRGDFHLKVDISQNNERVLRDFENAVGIPGGLYEKNSDWATKQMYTLLYASDTARKVLDVVEPYLVRKKVEAALARRFNRECYIGYRGWRCVPAEIIARRSVYKSWMSRLKCRPPRPSRRSRRRRSR